MALRPCQDRGIGVVEVGGEWARHKNHLGYGNQEGTQACDRKEACAYDLVRVRAIIHELFLRSISADHSRNRRLERFVIPSVIRASWEMAECRRFANSPAGFA